METTKRPSVSKQFRAAELSARDVINAPPSRRHASPGAVAVALQRERAEESLATAVHATASALAKTTSKLWSWYVRKEVDTDGNGVAMCKLCRKEVKFHKSTSNLGSHLDTHREVSQEMRTWTESRVNAWIHNRDLAGPLDKLLKTMTPELEYKFRRELALCIWAVSCEIGWRAFTTPAWQIVREECGLGDLVQGDQMRRRVFSELRDLVREDIRNILEGVPAVAATSDGWSHGEKHLICMTISWCDESLKVFSLPIATQICSGSRTAAIVEIWEEASSGPSSLLPKNVLVGAMTTDSGSNFRNAAKRFVGNESAWPCICHTINRIVEKAINEGDDRRLFARVHTFVEFVFASSLRRTAFDDARAECGIERSPTGLVQRIETRWFSALHEARSYIKNLKAVAAFVENPENHVEERGLCVRDLVMLDSDVLTLTQILDILGLLEEFLCKAEAESSSTLCHVPQWATELHKALQPDCAVTTTTQQTWKALLRGLVEERIMSSVFRPDSIALCAAALHPAYGALEFPAVTPEMREAIWELVLSDIMQLQPVDSPTDPIPRTEEQHRNSVRALRAVWERRVHLEEHGLLNPERF